MALVVELELELLLLGKDFLFDKPVFHEAKGKEKILEVGVLGEVLDFLYTQKVWHRALESDYFGLFYFLEILIDID